MLIYLDMRFKNWFIVEDINTQKEKYTKQGYPPDVVARYLADFKVIKDKKYKQINDPIHGLENIKNRVDIDQYQDFHQLEVLVDYVKGQVDFVGITNYKTNYKNLNFSGEPIYEDQNIQIFYADSPRACVEYKGNAPYGWCIARNDSGNMFHAYRYKPHQPAFYFVKNKEKTNTEFGLMQGIKNVVNTISTRTSKFKDKYHFFVIQVLKNANPSDHTQKQYVVTSAENDGDKEMSWEEIIQIEPHLQGKEETFQPKPLTKEESEFYKKYMGGISDLEFIKLPYDQKDMFMNIYVNLDKGLSDKQYSSLPEDLKNKYIGFGVGLTDEQYSNTNDKLKKRYVDVTIKKIEVLIEQKKDFKLKNSEIEILINNISRFDINKLSDQNVGHLLATDKQEIAELIIQNKKELSDQNVSNLIDHAIYKQEMIKLIIQNKKKLSGNDVYNLLLHATDKQEIAELIIQNKKELSHHDVYNLISAEGHLPDQEMIKLIIQNKKELSDSSVYYLIHYATNKQEIIELLGEDNISKLSDHNVYYLINQATNKQEIIELLGEDNISKLSDHNVYYLINQATNKQEIIELLGEDNMSKLSDSSVYNLINQATDKQEIAKLIIQNKIKLSDNNVLYLIDSPYNKDKQEMIKLIIQNKKELSDSNVSNLIGHAKDKQEIAKLIIQNKKELSLIDVRNLIYYATDKQEMIKLLTDNGVKIPE